jgi:hypothetical protein
MNYKEFYSFILAVFFLGVIFHHIYITLESYVHHFCVSIEERYVSSPLFNRYSKKLFMFLFHWNEKSPLSDK